MIDFLANYYLWIKALHIMAVMSWLAGLFYLPRIYVYHVEQSTRGDQADCVFQIMEEKLLRVIMTPAMLASWICGLILAVLPGVIDFTMIWVWLKLFGILSMSWFHLWLIARRKEFMRGENKLSGRQYRLMNEVPTLLMVLIVVSVVVKFA